MTAPVVLWNTEDFFDKAKKLPELVINEEAGKLSLQVWSQAHVSSTGT
jgi:hypothetical protein